MQENNQGELKSGLGRVHLHSMLTDILRNWWVILLGALATAMIASVVVQERSHIAYEYTTNATLVVSSRGSSNVYSNLSSAQSTAATLSNIMNSSFMQKTVCDDLGLTQFNATVSASVISETNLLVLTVSAESPKLAYQVIRSIMDNYSVIADSTVGRSMIEVLEEPEVPTGGGGTVDTRSAMKKGFAMGLAVFVLLFAYLSYQNDTVKATSDLTDKLDAKALGTVYYEKKYKTLRSRLRSKKSSILVTDPTVSFGFVESYKKIAAKMTYMKQRDQGEMIVVTSLLENEGKSTAAVNLALSLAMNSKRVLLMDCDLRRPSQYLILNRSKKLVRNWTDLLFTGCSVQDVIQYDEERGIFMLLETKGHDNSAELLAGETMRQILAALRDYFDYIVLDSPPMAVAADAEVLADQSDFSVLIARYNMAQARDINDAIDALVGCNAALAGCILNQAQTLPGLGGPSYSYSGRSAYGKYGKSEKKR